MAVVGVYRRVLPSPPAIEFASLPGKQLFAEALQGGTMESFFKLISYYQTQSEPAFCGLASLSMVLNALAVDPRRTWKGPWRWFDDSMLDCCEPLVKIKTEGVTFGQLACLADCNGAKVDTFRTNESSIDDFRKNVVSCTSCEDCHVIVSYSRNAFNQTGSGHFSPIGGYHKGKDMVLILDVARFKYPPHWVPLELLWEGMDTIDEATGHRRGFMIMSRINRAPSILYTVSSRCEGWNSVAQYLTADFPLVLKTEDVKNIDEVLSVAFKSPPSDVREFINWVADVCRQEDGGLILSEEVKGRLAIKEEVLKQVRETELFKHVIKCLVSESLRCKDVCTSGRNDTLPEITANVCFQGAKLLTRNFSSSEGVDCWKADAKFLNSDSDKPVTLVSDPIISDGTEQGVDVLVPLSQMGPSGLYDLDQNCCGGMHPSAGEVLTVLLFALPQHTWYSIKEEKLQAEISSLASIGNLPPLLQEEVLHLRRQLHFLTTDLGAA